MPTILGELVGVEARSRGYMNLHVLSKVFLPLFISLSLPFARQPLQALAVALVSVAACVAAGVPLSAMKRYLAVIISLVAFIVLAFSLFAQVPGRVLYEVTLVSIHAQRGVVEWKLVITDTGLWYSAAFILRVFAMVLSAVLLLASVTDRDLVWGLLSLRAPFGASVAASLFFRGIHFFISDFYTVREAMMARGVDFERSSLARRFRLYSNALIPLLSLMVTRSYEVSLALESRGIAPGSRSASGYHVYRLRPADYAVLAVGASVLAAFIVWGWLA
ncbi:MAG: energy-coupling factor transporter transmembrane protein EcfT [Acidilobus sp.]|jgi:energy-coupling factor transport system permease protein|nr:energy-coupling factor transporter transmembrane protein EcfT [Acidilobus sp.]